MPHTPHRPSLTGEQRAILPLVGEREPAIAIAGAGTGKTAALVEKILYDQAEGREPSQQMVVAFTNAAASELRQRLEAAGVDTEFYYLGTIHGWALRLVANQAKIRGRKLLVATDAVFDKVIGGTLRATGVRASIREVRGILAGTRERPARVRLQRVVRAVQRELNESCLVHPDTMLTSALKTLQEGAADEELPVGLRVYADEMQDSAPVEWLLYDELGRRTRAGVLAIGDPRQSIFEFRGADPNQLVRRFQAADERIVLTRNFRSGPALVHAANRVAEGMALPAELNRPMVSAADASPPCRVAGVTEFTTAQAEAQHLGRLLAEPSVDGGRASEIGARVRDGASLAILHRYNAGLRLTQDQLLGRGIDTRHQAALSDESWEALFTIVKRGSLALEDWTDAMTRAGVSFDEQRALLARRGDPPSLDQAASLLYDRNPNRPGVAKVGAGTVEALTIHGAKGREWDLVWLAGGDHQALRADKAEDRRLVYVALTRARSEFLASFAVERPDGAELARGLTMSALLEDLAS